MAVGIDIDGMPARLLLRPCTGDLLFPGKPLWTGTVKICSKNGVAYGCRPKGKKEPHHGWRAFDVIRPKGMLLTDRVARVFGLSSTPIPLCRTSGRDVFLCRAYAFTLCASPYGMVLTPFGHNALFLLGPPTTASDRATGPLAASSTHSNATAPETTIFDPAALFATEKLRLLAENNSVFGTPIATSSTQDEAATPVKKRPLIQDEYGVWHQDTRVQIVHDAIPTHVQLAHVANTSDVALPKRSRRRSRKHRPTEQKDLPPTSTLTLPPSCPLELQNKTLPSKGGTTHRSTSSYPVAAIEGLDCAREAPTTASSEPKEDDWDPVRQQPRKKPKCEPAPAPAHTTTPMMQRAGGADSDRGASAVGASSTSGGKSANAAPPILDKAKEQRVAVASAGDGAPGGSAPITAPPTASDRVPGPPTNTPAPEERFVVKDMDGNELGYLPRTPELCVSFGQQDDTFWQTMGMIPPDQYIITERGSHVVSPASTRTWARAVKSIGKVVHPSKLKEALLSFKDEHFTMLRNTNNVNKNTDQPGVFRAIITTTAWEQLPQANQSTEAKAQFAVHVIGNEAFVKTLKLKVAALDNRLKKNPALVPCYTQTKFGLWRLKNAGPPTAQSSVQSIATTAPPPTHSTNTALSPPVLQMLPKQSAGGTVPTTEVHINLDLAFTIHNMDTWTEYSAKEEAEMYNLIPKIKFELWQSDSELYFDAVDRNGSHCGVTFTARQHALLCV